MELMVNTCHYHGNLTASLILTLPTYTDCQVKNDIMIVLDESGSISSMDFQSAKQFVLQYISNLRIGPNDNRVGLITFSSYATLRFRLDTYNSASLLEQAVENVFQNRGFTNIPAALCELHNAFIRDARRDNTVFRVGIVMTDGKSNENQNPCGYQTVAEAAEAIRNTTEPILVFAFGVGTAYSRQDIRNIASGDEFVGEASSFSTAQLECVQRSQEDKICHRSECMYK